jgi:hypothetical protein
VAPLGSRRSPAQTPAWATGQCPEASSALQLAEPKDALPAENTLAKTGHIDPFPPSAGGRGAWTVQISTALLRRKVSVPQHRPRRSPSASQRRRPASPPWTFSRIECRTFHRVFARKSGYLLYEHAGAGVAPACRTCSSGGGGSPMLGTGLQRASGPSCCWPKCCDSVAPYHLSLSG